MTNIREYGKAVRLQMEALPEPFYYTMSLEDPSRGLFGGAVVQVSKESAARALVEKRARLATPEEIEAHFKAEKAKREGYDETDQRYLRLNPNFRIQGNQPPVKRAKE